MSNLTVSYDQKTELFGFKIPGEKEVTGVGKDEIKKIFKEIFPDELKKELGGALKDVSQDVLKEVVNEVFIPVVEDVLKPLEKLMFDRGAHALKLAYDETKKLIDSSTYTPPVDLIAKAKEYAKYQADADDNPWVKWLGAMGVEGYEVDPDVDKTQGNYWQWQLEIWDGWKPFIVALHKYEHRPTYTSKQIIADFNKINFYVANSGNLSIGLYFSGMYDRTPDIIATLNKYKDTGVPIKRGDIEHFITELGPQAIDITGSAKVNLGIEIGGSVGLWGVPTELCLYFLDEVLKYAGVPA